MKTNECPIIRTYVVKHGTLNLETMLTTHTSEEIVTGPCGTPLFGNQRYCRSCSAGWEVEDNRFASDAERERAQRANPSTDV